MCVCVCRGGAGATAPLSLHTRTPAPPQPSRSVCSAEGMVLSCCRGALHHVQALAAATLPECRRPLYVFTLTTSSSISNVP